MIKVSQNADYVDIIVLTLAKWMHYSISISCPLFLGRFSRPFSFIISDLKHMIPKEHFVLFALEYLQILVVSPRIHLGAQI